MKSKNSNVDNKTVNFRANASLKDIVGRGLIYDDNIAITELVKNAKDAGSPIAKIEFSEEITLSPKSRLVIRDSGKGMTLLDIKDKWLNIAYSEKKGVTLDNGATYAGNKGVGRFSCDRLGEELVLYTRSLDGDFIKLPIVWKYFENRGRDEEISSIQLKYEIQNRSTFVQEIGDEDFEHGTVLFINKLRSEWNSKKLAKLIGELEKFSPSLDAGFEVYLNSSSSHKDKSVAEKINKKINNNILEKLAFKTTYIKSSIDSSGLNISTTIYYQGSELYSYTAKNPYGKLKNINVEIHYLDTLAKSYFTRKTGVSPNDYGSIFLFYNGFRVSPYGNDKNDWLGLDQRKSQGTARYLGTRELFGRIDIVDQDDTFHVITSREGLANNKAFADLTAFDPDEKTSLIDGKLGYGYITIIIRQLETFVVRGLDWNGLIDRLNPGSNKVISEADVLKNPDRYQLSEISIDKVKEAGARILKSDWKVENFLINDALILSLSKVAEDKYHQFVEDFVQKSGEKEFAELSAREKGFIRQIVVEEQARTQAAVDERNIAVEQRRAAEARVEVEKRRSHFLEALASPEKTLDALITHVMKQISGGIEKDVKSLLSQYYKDSNRVSKEDLIDALEHIVIDVSLIKETATMASKADFNLKISSIKEDIFSFIEDYVSQIASKDKKWGLRIHFSNPEKLSEVRTFNPAKLCVFFVNVLDNARKAGARNVFVACSPGGIRFSDDGSGFDFATYSAEDFFRKGVTTTDGGSGLGLYHCKQIAIELKSAIRLENDEKTRGASVVLEFSK